MSTYQEEITVFADVIIPVAIPNLYTYRVPREYANSIQVGARVIVQFRHYCRQNLRFAKLHNDPRPNLNRIGVLPWDTIRI